jgi:hypothetical protein
MHEEHDSRKDNDTDRDALDDLDSWLDDQDGSGPPLWDPQVGDKLVGTFLRYETRYSTKIGDDCPVAIIEEPRTRQLHTVWLTRNVLANEYKNQNPQPGDIIAHRYHGQKEPRGGGRPYHNYTVRVVPASRPPSSAPSAPPPPQVITTAPPTPPPAPAAGSDDELPL